MSRILTFCAAILVLALVATVPTLAEAPAQIEQAQGEPAQLDLAPAEEPLITPAEEPTELDLLGLERSNQNGGLEACPVEEQLCPPGCACLIIRGQVNCYCAPWV